MRASLAALVDAKDRRSAVSALGVSCRQLGSAYGRCELQNPSTTRARLHEPLAHVPFVLAEEDAPEFGEPLGRIFECAEDPLTVLDCQGDDRRLSSKRGEQECGRRLVDKVREYLHEFVVDGDAGELHGRDGIGRLLLVAFARECAVEGRIPRCRCLPRLRCPIDLLVVVAFDLSLVVHFGFVVFDAVSHRRKVPSSHPSQT